MIKNGLTTVSLVVGIIVGVFGFVQAYAVLPYRVEQNEKAIHTLQEESKINRDILIRIEERIKLVQKEVNK